MSPKNHLDLFWMVHIKTYKIFFCYYVSMDYFATTITQFSFKQIDKMTDKTDLFYFEQLCFDYPLIFVKREHAIIFFNIRVILDQIQYDFLYQLVRNATKEKEQKGLSSIELFQLAKCRHTREESRNKNLSEYDRADERIRDIKRRIKSDIKEQYKKLKNEHEKKIKKYEGFGFDGLDNLKCFTPIGIYESNTTNDNKKYFNGSIEIGSDSPYYYFNIDTAIDLLITRQRDKDKKHTTEFTFKA